MRDHDADCGGDVDALRDPAEVWGRLIAEGITAFQTDEPAALLDFVQHARRGNLARASGNRLITPIR